MNLARCSASSRVGFQPPYHWATSSALCASHRSRAFAGPAGSSRRRAVNREFDTSGIREVLQEAHRRNIPALVHPILRERGATLTCRSSASLGGCSKEVG